MSVQVEGINFLKYVLEMVLRLDYSEPAHCEIHVKGDFIRVKLGWNNWYPHESTYIHTTLNVYNTGWGYLQLEDLQDKYLTHTSLKFKTSDIRIIV